MPYCTTDNDDLTNQSPTQSIRSISPAKEKFKKKVKALQQKLRRKEKKISSILDMVSLLKSKNYMTNDAATVFSKKFHKQKIGINFKYCVLTIDAIPI